MQRQFSYPNKTASTNKNLAMNSILSIEFSCGGLIEFVGTLDKDQEEFLSETF
jgi:hypothetical protein